MQGVGQRTSTARGGQLTGLANGAQSSVVYRNGPVLRVEPGAAGAPA